MRGRRGGSSSAIATLERRVRTITCAVSSLSASDVARLPIAAVSECSCLKSCQVPSWPGRNKRDKVVELTKIVLQRRRREQQEIVTIESVE